MLRWITAFSLALATSAAALPAQAQVWVPAWTASPAPDRLDGTPEAPVQFANQTVRQDMRLASSARALRFRISNELGQAPLHIGSASAHLTGTATAAKPVTFNGRGEIVVPVGAALLRDGKSGGEGKRVGYSGNPGGRGYSKKKHTERETYESYGVSGQSHKHSTYPYIII